MGRVDVLSGGLEADECLFKNEIRSGPLLGGVFLIFRLYTTPLFCSLFYESLFVLSRDLIIYNNIIAVKKKSKDN
jgi:hypothetical protein